MITGQAWSSSSPTSVSGTASHSVKKQDAVRVADHLDWHVIGANARIVLRDMASLGDAGYFV